MDQRRPHFLSSAELTAALAAPQHRGVKLWVGLFVASIVAVVSCGARTGLPVEPGAGGGGGSVPEAGPDVVPDVLLDAAPDAPPDAEADAPFDAPLDVVADVALDAIVADDCQDAGTTYIYLISGQNILVRFDPSMLTATPIGTIDCPANATDAFVPTPYSMAVNRAGVAYVVFTDGELFRVSTLTASCEPTGFVVGQNGFSTEFGMGYSADVSDPGETLFVAGNVSEQLASVDTTTFTVSPIGVFSSMIGEAELTGTGDGALYAFGIVTENSMTAALHLAHVDKATATVLDDVFVTVASGTSQIFDWAFAYWGGAFYFFTSSDGQTTIVSRYVPGGPLDLPTVATIDTPIVGAGVSTCAPTM
jgi:hypothetical protein